MDKNGIPVAYDLFPGNESEKVHMRPIYVWLNEHIDTHFATCFLALVLIRLLEHKLGNKYPTARILIR